MEILFAILLGLFLGALDQTIVGVALPTIVTDLGGQTLLTWTITIYLLTSTITVPFYGKLSDLYGRKPMLMFGITVFLIGSALSGLSQDMTQLIIFRGIQGLGAGALFPISLAVIGDLFTPAERGKYQGLFGAVFGISAIVGPLLGGFLTEHAVWHWIFFINIPIGIVALAVIGRLLPNVQRPGVTHNLDFLGGGVFTVAVGALLIGLTNKQTSDWQLVRGRRADPHRPRAGRGVRVHRVAGQGADRPAGPVEGPHLLVLDHRDVPDQLRVLRGRRVPAAVVPVRLGRHAHELGAVLAGAARGPDHQLRRLGPDHRLANRQVQGRHPGRPRAHVGGLVLMSNIQADTPLPVLWAWMFVTGLGIGPTLSVFTIVVQNAVPMRALGVATSNLTFFRQIGGSVGLALLGTVFGTRLASEIPVQLAPLASKLVAAGVPPDKLAALQGGGQATSLIEVGKDLGETILVAIPEPLRDTVAPFINDIVFAHPPGVQPRRSARCS